MLSVTVMCFSHKHNQIMDAKDNKLKSFQKKNKKRMGRVVVRSFSDICEMSVFQILKKKKTERT